MKLIKDYKSNAVYRKSMSDLAEKTFGLNFERLYEKGYWDDRFKSYAFVDQEKVVSNVCFHELTLLRDGQTYDVIQIGTVMTDLDYRKQGLARKLMEAVLEDYRHKDAFYLFANDSVMDFYPLFDFEQQERIFFELNKNLPIYDDLAYQKLDVEVHLSLIDYYVKNRVRNHRDEVLYDDYLKAFYMLYVFEDAVYMVDDVLVVCEKLGDSLHVYDVFMTEEKDILQALKPFMADIKKIRFHFELNIQGLNCEIDQDQALFVRTDDMMLKQPWSYPTTSIT